MSRTYLPNVLRFPLKKKSILEGVLSKIHGHFIRKKECFCMSLKKPHFHNPVRDHKEQPRSNHHLRYISTSMASTRRFLKNWGVPGIRISDKSGDIYSFLFFAGFFCEEFLELGFIVPSTFTSTMEFHLSRAC